MSVYFDNIICNQLDELLLALVLPYYETTNKLKTCNLFIYFMLISLHRKTEKKVSERFKSK